MALTLTGCQNIALPQTGDTSDTGKTSKDPSSEDLSGKDSSSKDPKETSDNSSTDSSTQSQDDIEDNIEDNADYQVVDFDENLMTVTVEPYGEVDLIPLVDKDTGKWSSFSVRQDDEEIVKVGISFRNGQDDETYMDTISEVGVEDLDQNGISDFVVIGEQDGASRIQISMGDYEAFDEEQIGFKQSDWAQDAEEYLASDYHVAGVISFLKKEHIDGQFDCWQDAYEWVIGRLNEGVDYDGFEYALIYFDDDDIPELVMDYPGYSVSMCSYRDGKLVYSINAWPYGAFGNPGYDYYEKGNLVIGSYTEYGGDIQYTCYYRMDNSGEVHEVYEAKCYYCYDIDGDGTITADEEGQMEYFCYTGEDLTQEEIKHKIDDQKDELSDKKLKGLNGEINLIDLGYELNASNWKVTKLEGDDITFTAGGKDYNLLVKETKDYHKEFTLTDGNSQYQKEILCNTQRIYLIEKTEGKSFLYVNISDENNCDTLYVFNLNNMQLSAPAKVEDYSLYYTDITDANCFALLKAEDIFGRSVVKKTFTVGLDGMPVTNDKYEYYVGISSIGESGQVGETGETIITKEKMTLESDEDPNDDYYFGHTEVPKGSNLTLYRTDGETFVDLITDDGIGVRFKIEDGVICDKYTVDNFEDVPIFG